MLGKDRKRSDMYTVVDVNKGTSEKPDVRCRLVARDFKPKGEKDREDLFAAMPPLEAKKLVFQKAVRENGERRRRGQDGIKLMFVDVKKAHLYGVVPDGEYVYIELPGEAGKEGKCGRLKKCRQCVGKALLGHARGHGLHQKQGRPDSVLQR